MSLTGRFSALFLAALGLVLVAFSTVLYVSAQIYLDRQVSDRLDAALAVLAAAAEIHPDGVEWEPQERVLRWARSPGPTGCVGLSSTVGAAASIIRATWSTRI